MLYKCSITLHLCDIGFPMILHSVYRCCVPENY